MKPNNPQQQPSALISQDSELSAPAPPDSLVEVYQRLAALEEEVALMRRAGTLPPLLTVTKRLKQCFSNSGSDTEDDDSTSEMNNSTRSDSLSSANELSRRKGDETIAKTDIITVSAFYSRLNSVADTAQALVDTFGWEVTFARSGYQIHTTIHTIQDLLDFATTNLQFIFAEPMHSLRNISVDDSSRMVIRTKVAGMFVDKLRIALNSKRVNDFVKTYYSPTSTALSYESTLTKSLIDTILQLLSSATSPMSLIVHPSVVPLLYDPRDPMSSPALCILAACMIRIYDSNSFDSNSLDRNIFDHLGHYTGQPDLYGHCHALFNRAIDLLDESMFDEPNFPGFIAICLCAFYSMGTLSIKKAWTYRGLAFRMTSVMLQTRYRGISHSSFDEGEVRVFPAVTMIEWEIFKRNHWANVLIETVLSQYGIHDSAIPERELLELIGEFPMPLDSEDFQRRRMINTMIAMAESIKIALPYRPGSDRVSLRDITESEAALDAWYSALPADLRLATYTELTPAKIAAMHKIDDLDHPSLALSIQYHVLMIRIHEEFLPEFPPTPASSAPCPSSLRSHDICTLCATLITALYESMSTKISLGYFLPALLKACDVHYRNTLSEDPVIRKNAARDLETSLNLAKHVKEKMPRDLTSSMRNDIYNILEELGLGCCWDWEREREIVGSESCP